MTAPLNFSDEQLRSEQTNDFPYGLERMILSNLQHKQLSISWLAKRMHYSDRQFHRLVKKHTGMTCNKYIRELRLLCAREILFQGNYSTKEVAYIVGYQKTSWFSTQYFIRFGTRPKKVQKLI